MKGFVVFAIGMLLAISAGAAEPVAEAAVEFG